MSFAAIIQMIITILTFLAGLFEPKAGVRQTVSARDFTCDRPVWVGSPAVKDGVFAGTAEVKCEFLGQKGGGIAELQDHMVRQLPLDGQAQGTVQVATYEGQPSVAWKTKVALGSEATAHGRTVISSDGFSFLRNIFDSESIDATGNGQYVKGVHAEINVRMTEESYEMRVVQEYRVKKPGLISSASFKSKLMQQAEEAIERRAVDAVAEFSQHL